MLLLMAAEFALKCQILLSNDGVLPKYSKIYFTMSSLDSQGCIKLRHCGKCSVCVPGLLSSIVSWWGESKGVCRVDGGVMQIVKNKWRIRDQLSKI